MNVRKIVVLGVAIIMGVTLAGCGKTLTVKSQDTHNGFNSKVTGKSSESAIYWKTDADGINKVKTKDGKFTFDIPSKAHKFSMTVSNSKDMSDAKSLSFKKTKGLASYTNFYNAYNLIYDSSANDMPYTPKYGKNYAQNTNKNSLQLNVDDDKILGINVYSSNDRAWFIKMVPSICGALSADTDTVQEAVDTAAKKPGQSITTQSGSAKYTFNIDANKQIFQMIVHP